jgi:hypothetical protein
MMRYLMVLLPNSQESRKLKLALTAGRHCEDSRVRRPGNLLMSIHSPVLPKAVPGQQFIQFQ